MNEKEKVEYLISKGWTPHPRNPDRFWKSPNHKNEYVTYGTDKAYDSQVAFENGTTIKATQAARSVSKESFYVTLTNSLNCLCYLVDGSFNSMYEKDATKYPDLKSAVAAANIFMMNPPEGFSFYGFEAVKKDG